MQTLPPTGKTTPDSRPDSQAKPPRYPRRLTRTHLWLAGIFVLGVALRFPCLDCFGLWYDEVASIGIAQRGLAAILTDRFGGMLVQTPLHYLLVWLTIQPVDPTTTAVLVRLPSAIAGAVTPLVVYALGKELFGRAQCLLAALLIAISAIHIGHSQDVRPYTLLVLFTALTVYCLLRAERGGGLRWWVVFVLSLLLDIYISYFTLTLVLPALSIYLLWIIARGSRGDMESRKVAFDAVLSSLTVGILSIPMALDLLRVHRTAPDWSLFLDIAGRQIALLPARLAQLGIAGSLEEAIQWGLFALGLVGFMAALITKKTRGALLCALFLLVPALLLAAFRTTNIVFQRYALFAMPFYFLLLANGLTFLWTRRSRSATARLLIGYASGGLATLLVLLFAYSDLLYFTPDQHRQLSFLPDYRGVAHYLSRTAHTDDLIVMVDEPALGKAVVDLYWKGTPPAPVVDARDPTLFSQRPRGTIFWVVSFFQNDPQFLKKLSEPGEHWSSSTSFERIAVLEGPGDGGPRPGLERLVNNMEQQLPTFEPVLTLKGCIQQSTGDVAEAAKTYSSAGAYYPSLGEEFLATAEGYAERGDPDMAWREAVTSKFMQPDNPEVHRWLANRLKEQGDYVQSQAELEIAQALEKAVNGK